MRSTVVFAFLVAVTAAQSSSPEVIFRTAVSLREGQGGGGCGNTLGSSTWNGLGSQLIWSDTLQFVQIPNNGTLTAFVRAEVSASATATRTGLLEIRQSSSFRYDHAGGWRTVLTGWVFGSGSKRCGACARQGQGPAVSGVGGPAHGASRVEERIGCRDGHNTNNQDRHSLHCSAAVPKHEH